MKFKKILLIFLVTVSYVSFSSAQQAKRGIDLSFLAGVNLGATTPVPIPDAVDITKYNPKFNPKLGANVVYYFNERWGIGSGLTVDWKGMNISAKVDEVHLSVNVPNLGTLTGYVTGKNTTKVNTFYLTQPVYGVFRFNPRWQIKAGIYMAENLHRSFKGEVTDVVIMVQSPLSQERDIDYATFDYSDDAHIFDIGLLAGGEFRMNEHFGFFADFTWGLNTYFSKEVPIHFDMRNIYLSLGVTYRIN